MISRKSVPTALAALLIPAAAALAVTAAAPMQPGPGVKAPAFTLPAPDGREVTLSDLRGKVVLLSFWDCYADVCFTTVGVMEELAAKYPPEKFAAVTVCYEVPPSLAADGYKNLMKSCGAGQTVLIDRERLVSRLYGVSEAPTTFLLDGEGTIRERIVGVIGLRGQDFRGMLDGLAGPADQK